MCKMGCAVSALATACSTMYISPLRQCRCHLQHRGASRLGFAPLITDSRGLRLSQVALSLAKGVGVSIAESSSSPSVPSMTPSKEQPAAPWDFSHSQDNVPQTLSEALKLFVTHPSVLSATAIISCALYTRLGGGPLGLSDIPGTQDVSPLRPDFPSICQQTRS